jgi:Flp pilus assembly protein TadD
MHPYEYHAVERFIHQATDEFFNKNYELSIKHFSIAAELDNDDPMVFLTRGMAFMELGFIKEALTDFRRAEDMGLRLSKNFIEVSLWEVNENGTKIA